MLDFPPDWTFVLQFCGFFALLFVLDRLLFRPFMAVLDQREMSTRGVAGDAASDRAAANALRAQFDSSIAEAKAAAHAEAEAIRRDTQTREAAIFDDAKAAVAERHATLRSALEQEASSARASLRGEARALADAMVTAVLGRKS
jgi:F-type H+-transporting ATPase subunit b